LHIAAALGTPVVAVFGPTNPRRNGPYSKRARVVRAADVETTYSRSAGQEAITRVTVDEVFHALKEVAA
jgi:heptosyltransferase-1